VDRRRTWVQIIVGDADSTGTAFTVELPLGS
jgi:hypothetical protein